MTEETNCELCGAEIRYYDEGECQECYDLRCLMEDRPAVALKIAAKLKEK